MLCAQSSSMGEKMGHTFQMFDGHGGCCCARMSVAGQRARALQQPETKIAYITKYDSILGNSPFTKNPSSIQSSSSKANVLPPRIVGSAHFCDGTRFRRRRIRCLPLM